MLTDFFYTLRAAKLPVSVKEFLTLLEALRAGVIEPSVDQFYFLARTSLVKDEALYDRFDRAFAAYFKGVEMIADFTKDIPLEWLRKNLELELIAASARTRPGRARASDANRRWTLGVIATAEGRAWEGEIELNTAAQTHPCPICVLPDLARAYEVAGKPDQAIATYERYLNTPWQRRHDTDAVELGFAIERLGARKDGVIRGHAIRRDGTIRDTVMYSLRSGEWPEVKAQLLYLLDKPRPSKS